MLTPPPLPPSLPSFQTCSDTHDSAGPLVDNVVPPTSVMYGVSPGKRDQAGIGVAIAGGAKKDCPCAAICMKNLVRRPAAGATVADIPGATDLFGQIVRGHLVEDVVPVAGRLINDHLGKARRHGNGHLDVQRDLDFAARPGRPPVNPSRKTLTNGTFGKCAWVS